MRILIAEDDFTSRLFMEKYLSQYGKCDLAQNGIEAIELAKVALQNRSPFDLISLDIMMPKVDGLRALRSIRELESSLLGGLSPSKIIMTTALNDKETVAEAYANGCEAYAWKPIEVEKFNKVLKQMKLIE